MAGERSTSTARGITRRRRHRRRRFGPVARIVPAILAAGGPPDRLGPALLTEFLPSLSSTGAAEFASRASEGTKERTATDWTGGPDVPEALEASPDLDLDRRGGM